MLDDFPRISVGKYNALANTTELNLENGPKKQKKILLVRIIED